MTKKLERLLKIEKSALKRGDLILAELARIERMAILELSVYNL